MSARIRVNGKEETLHAASVAEFLHALGIGGYREMESPHPGQVKAELNSGAHIQDAVALEKRIQHMLFADQIEEAENV